MPLRYLPVRTPRPSGDHGRMPRPSAAAAGHDVELDVAVEQGVLHLRRRERRTPGDGALPGGGLGGLPAGVVRDPDVRRPAGRDRQVQRGEGLLERYAVDPGVHLPEVDVVDAEPPERPVEVGQEPAARGVGLALAAAARDAALGREHDLVAGDHVADQPADQLLGRAVGVSRGGVDQGAARLGEGDQLVTGLVLVGVPTPRHGSQAEPRDREARGTDRPLLHAPKGSRSPARGGRAARRSIRALAWVRPHHSRRRKARDELLRRHHPRHRGRADRVPPDLQHRPPHDRGAGPRPAGRRPGGDRLHRRHPDGRDRGGDPLLRPRHRAIIKAWCLGLVKPEWRGHRDFRMGWYVIVGTIPVGLVGLAFKDFIKNDLRNLWVVAVRADRSGAR